MAFRKSRFDLRREVRPRCSTAPARRAGIVSPAGVLRSRTSKLVFCTGAGVKTGSIERGGGARSTGVGEGGRGGGAVVSGGNVGKTRGRISRLGATLGGGREPAGGRGAAGKGR